jgi:MFS family permease
VNPLCSRHRSLQLALGFAIAPMILAPLSEINGRRPVFIASGILFVICQLCTGITRSYAGMLVVRFFVGVGGSTFSTMGKYQWSNKYCSLKADKIQLEVLSVTSTILSTVTNQWLFFQGQHFSVLDLAPLFVVLLHRIPLGG